MKKFVTSLFLAGLTLVGAFFALPTPAHAAYELVMSPEQLSAEIDEFEAAGADAYIMWQYSGELNGTYFGNDDYSWFRDRDPGPEICAAFKEKSSSSMLVGVNIWELTKFDQGTIDRNLSYLSDECGIEIIRTFAYPGGADGVARVLESAQARGIQVVVAIGDHANGGGGMPKGAAKDWYQSGYQTEYLGFARDVIGVARNFGGAVYAIELANEPHCFDDASAIPVFKTWGQTIGGMIQSAGLPSGYGQFPNDEPNSACDSPALDPSGFINTNSISAISKTSGHYYNASGKSLTLQALEQSRGTLGKPFYVGEAGWGGDADDETDRSDYYLYPIDGINEGDQDAMLRSLITQGYEVQCTVPTVNIQPKLGGLFEYAPESGIPVFVEGTMKADVGDAAIPLWRDTGRSGILASLENYWGFQDTTVEDPVTKRYASAPLFSLYPAAQQCEEQMQILQTIDRMCSRLKDPSTCALYQSIPESSFDTKTIYPEMQKLLARYGNMNQACIHLTSKNDEQLAQESSQLPEIKKAIRNTPLYLDKAYRVGFLLMTAEMKPSFGEQFFNFLLKGKTDAEPKHEVRVLSFKVPDIGTNKDYNSDIYYEDPLMLTQRAHRGETATKKYIQQEIDRRNTFVREAINLEVNFETNIIKCAGNACGSPLAQALVKFINANEVECRNPEGLDEYEPSDTIGSSAELVADQDRVYSDSQNQEYSPEEALAEQGANQEVNNFNFLSRVKIAPSGHQETGDSSVTGYLIIPYGNDLEQAENTLIGRFYGQQFIEQFRADEEIPDYFLLQDVLYAFEGTSKPQVPVVPPNGEDCLPDPGPGGPQTPEDEEPQPGAGCNAEAYLDQFDSDLPELTPRFPGGVFGTITRAVAQSVASAITNPPYLDYITSCKTTEDFLLGRCAGSKPGSSSSNNTGTNECIEVWVSPSEAQTYAQQLRSALPGQEERSDTFAGWKAYFSGVPGTQYLFRSAAPEDSRICGGQVCYDYILDEIQNVTKGGQQLNPYLAIAISLNETGGLKSIAPDASGRHFGCGVDPDNPGYIRIDTIQNKLQCLSGFFTDNSGLDSDAALTKYGYRNGYRNGNLNKIIGIISEGNYKGSCSQ